MMASGFVVDELIRRAVDLNVRYYSGMGQLMATYVKDLVVTFSDLATSQILAPPRPQNPSSGTKNTAVPSDGSGNRIGQGCAGCVSR
jgi:hypothetical protein